MYYEEKIIDGILHWRGAPDREFKAYTLQELSARYVEQQERIGRLESALERLRDRYESTCGYAL